MQLRSLHDGRTLLDTQTRWEPLMGYSRAVQAGETIHVSGCVGIEADGRYAPGLADQTSRAMARIQEALQAFGAGLDQIVRLRVYTTRMDEWPQIASVLGPLFPETRPANTLLGVESLVDAEALVEIEAEAWVGR